jgi:hypothetical protein
MNDSPLAAPARSCERRLCLTLQLRISVVSPLKARPHERHRALVRPRLRRAHLTNDPVRSFKVRRDLVEGSFDLLGVAVLGEAFADFVAKGSCRESLRGSGICLTQ